MMTLKHFFMLTVLILITLLMRDLPYINVVFIGKIWILYLLILLFVVLSSIKFRFALVTYGTVLLFVIVAVLTLLSLIFFAEAIGVLIYFSLWILVIHEIFSFYKEQRLT